MRGASGGVGVGLLGYPTAGAVGPYCRCAACEAVRRHTRRELGKRRRFDRPGEPERRVATYDGTWGWIDCASCGGEGVHTFDDWTRARSRYSSTGNVDTGPDEGREECEACSGEGTVPATACTDCGHLVADPDVDGKPKHCDECCVCDDCDKPFHPDAPGIFDDLCAACAKAATR